MTHRFAPWQRIVIAMARGILLKPSGKMKWTAHVTALAARPQEVETFNLISYDADSEADAARWASDAAAKRLYGDAGTTTFMETTDAPLYVTSIGLYEGRGVTRGRGLKILILPYSHPVTGK